MEAILTFVGVLGLGALLISVYVFAVAARNFVSEDESRRVQYAANSGSSGWIPRSREDRRQNRASVQFPIRVNGEIVLHDRRKGERRAA
jgi:hypothetical protein